MPDPSQDLAQLRDIHLPNPVGWWPLAVGWYLLATLACVAMMGLVFFTYRHYKNNRFKRKALDLLDSYQRAYLNQPNSQLSCAQLSELLKRVALVYYPREQVASLQGQAWLDFLNQTSSGEDFNQIRDLLLESPYQLPKECDVGPLFKAAKTWIKLRRGRCLN